jgi:hypothetical protein
MTKTIQNDSRGRGHVHIMLFFVSELQRSASPCFTADTPPLFFAYIALITPLPLHCASFFQNTM